MTTKVSISVEHVNVGPGKIVAGVAQGSGQQLGLYDCPMKIDLWISGDNRLLVREATDQDVIDFGKSVPAVTA